MLPIVGVLPESSFSRICDVSDIGDEQQAVARTEKDDRRSRRGWSRRPGAFEM